MPRCPVTVFLETPLMCPNLTDVQKGEEAYVTAFEKLLCECM